MQERPTTPKVLIFDGKNSSREELIQYQFFEKSTFLFFFEFHVRVSRKVILRRTQRKNYYLKVLPTNSWDFLDVFCTMNEYTTTPRSKNTFFQSTFILLESCHTIPQFKIHHFKGSILQIEISSLTKPLLKSGTLSKFNSCFIKFSVSNRVFDQQASCFINKFLSKIPVIGKIIIPKDVGEGLFGVSFKMKGMPGKMKTTINPIKTLTPRFITKALEKSKKSK